jgi:hypothetical protein
MREIQILINPTVNHRGAPGSTPAKEGLAMPNFMIPVDAISVRGTQIYRVEAESFKKAIEILRAGGGEFEYEDLEVMDLDFDSVCEDDTWTCEDNNDHRRGQQ